MALNGVNGASSPLTLYTNAGVSTQRVGTSSSGYDATPLQRPVSSSTRSDVPEAGQRVTQQSVADAIKQDATERLAQVNSAQAPDGVDQDLWSVLTKDERTFFMKAGGMGALTYGRFSQSSAASVAPIGRGGRLDVRA